MAMCLSSRSFCKQEHSLWRMMTQPRDQIGERFFNYIVAYGGSIVWGFEINNQVADERTVFGKPTLKDFRSRGAFVFKSYQKLTLIYISNFTPAICCLLTSTGQSW